MFRKPMIILLGVTIACYLIWGVVATPTYAGPNAGALIVTDLDVETAGVQSDITVPVGSSLEVDVIVQGASDLRGVNFDLLYDTGAVEVVSVEKGGFLKSGGGQTAFFTDTYTPGIINVSTIILAPTAPCVNDTGVLARITFKIKETQNSGLSFNNVRLTDCPATQEDNITSSAIGGTIFSLTANYAPVLDDIGDTGVNEGNTLTFVVNASDSNTGDTITYSVAGLPADKFNPVTHTFTWETDFDDSGIYSVTFIATDDKGASDSETITITVNDVNQLPVLDFIGNKSVNEAKSLTFIVTASDSDVGDTIACTAENLPTGAIFNNLTFTWIPGYDQAGTYAVTFIATDNHRASDSETILIAVNNVCQPPVLAPIDDQVVSVGEILTFEITASDSDTDDPLTYTITDLLAPAVFDAGTVPPTFTWDPDQTGTYSVTFTVTDSCGLSDSETISITVIEYKADFMASVTTGCEPSTVCFTDLSVGPINSWFWDFGDGETSTDSSPCHTYTIRGNYTISLGASGPNGADTETKAGYIKIYPLEVEADFMADLTSGCAPLLVCFTDSSTGEITGWAWDLDGDGRDDATIRNPCYTYDTPGTYTVTLEINGVCGSDSENKVAYIEVGWPLVDFRIYHYPNPCYPDKGMIAERTVKIANIPLNSHPVIYIYNIGGKLVRVLNEEEEIWETGDSMTAIWNARNDYGDEVASGVYIYILRCNKGIKKGKIAIIR